MFFKILIFIFFLSSVHSWSNFGIGEFRRIAYNNPDNLINWNTQELREKAKRLGIEQFSTMKKKNLIDKLERKMSLNRHKYMIDIDGTICKTENSNYPSSIPNYEMINKFNKLYFNGNEVHYWTARGAISGKNWDEFTLNQLESWGVKYTSINMGKPHYDTWIDDKAVNAFDFELDN
tara:strand:- start:471 stop:1001 length:531 start_codon:yes stop_codon:yes gene_type:complete